MKPIIHSTFGFKLEQDFKVPIEIWIDTLCPIDKKKIDGKKDIFIAMEPNVILHTNDYLKKYHYLFDYILTFNEELLQKIPNGILFEFGTKWIDLEKYSFPYKKFEISFVCGDKQTTFGHLLRQKIWYKQMKIKKPKSFYLSSNSPSIENIDNNKQLGEFKEPLFDSMFHVCVENNSSKYYFSEKLIDCLLCKSIPIYYGCTNLSDYFDMRGIYTFNTLEECLTICNNLTEEDYKKRIEFVEINYKKAIDWVDYPERLKTKIEEII